MPALSAVGRSRMFPSAGYWLSLPSGEDSATAGGRDMSALASPLAAPREAA
jgi:hypothetical protein